MKRLVVVCLAVLALGGLAQAQRLPKIAVPEHYGLKFTPDFATDKFSGEPKGFGFVEMSEKTEAVAAISGLNGQDMHGRSLNVNEAKPRVDTGNRDGGNGSRRPY